MDVIVCIFAPHARRITVRLSSCTSVFCFVFETNAVSSTKHTDPPPPRRVNLITTSAPLVLTPSRRWHVHVHSRLANTLGEFADTAGEFADTAGEFPSVRSNRGWPIRWVGNKYAYYTTYYTIIRRIIRSEEEKADGKKKYSLRARGTAAKTGVENGAAAEPRPKRACTRV
eukprot:1176529-Prorocentrum_minimum.AAC.1